MEAPAPELQTSVFVIPRGLVKNDEDPEMPLPCYSRGS